MEGLMQDRRRRGELEGLHSLGDLADDVVVSLGRVVRDEPLSDGDTSALRYAHDLFKLMTTHDVIVVGTTVGLMRVDERGYLDALRGVEREKTDESLEDTARRYATVLDEVLHRSPDDATEEAERERLKLEVEGLRTFFAGLGETSLARADELSRPPQETSWRSTLQPSSTS